MFHDCWGFLAVLSPQQDLSRRRSYQITGFRAQTLQGAGYNNTPSREMDNHQEWSFKNLFHLSGNPDPGPPNDGPVGRGDRVHGFPSIVGMTMGLSGHH
jgi:hypothetical protein